MQTNGQIIFSETNKNPKNKKPAIPDQNTSEAQSFIKKSKPDSIPMQNQPQEEKTNQDKLQIKTKKDDEIPADDKKAVSVKGVHSTSQSKQKLEKMADKISQPILKISNMLPFATTVTIDLRKVSIDFEPLPFTHEEESIPLEEIDDVEFESSFVFANLKIISKKENKPISISWLHPSQAKEAKEIILGLITAIKENIKVGDLDPIKDKDKLIDIGAAG